MGNEQRIRSLDSMSEAIALSSPSGRMSARARKAANKRFAALYLDFKPYEPNQKERDLARARGLLSAAEFLRGLAERGMGPRRHRHAAQDAETEAKQLRKRWEAVP